MLNSRSAAPLASLSLAGRFSPIWERGEGGEGWCWTPSTAGEEHGSQEASAPPRGRGPTASAPPLGIVSAASSCSAGREAAPPGRLGSAEDAPAWAARRMIPHEQRSTHWLLHPSQGKRGGRQGWWRCTMAPYRLVPLLCSVGFLNSPVQSAAYSPPGPAAPVSLPNCPLQGHGRHVGCGMRDASLSSQPSSKVGSGGGTAIPMCNGRADSEVPPDPGASTDRSRSH